MSVIFMKLYGEFKPYEKDSDDILQELSQYQVFFTLFAGLVIRTSALAGIASINNILSAFIIFVNIFTSAVTPFLVRDDPKSLAAYVKSFRKGVQNILMPQINRIVSTFKNYLKALFNC